MSYPFRHAFMENAIVEFENTFEYRRVFKIRTIGDAWRIMKLSTSFRERQDWFEMYCMGGCPWCARSILTK